MTSMWKRGRATALLAVVMLLWGCDTSTDPIPQSTAPEVEASGDLLGGTLGLIEETSDDLLDDGTELIEDTSDELLDAGDTFLNPVISKVVVLSEQVVGALIGSSGGTLSLLGHQLTVPAGAVLEPTAFFMIVLPGDKIEVELLALDTQTGRDVGAKGFLLPVRLAMSYANADGGSPNDLVIVHVLPDGTRIPLESTVDKKSKTVWADLEHFSRYALCRN